MSHTLSLHRSRRLSPAWFAFITLALACLALAPAAHAQTFISTDTTLDSSSPLSGPVYVGYANQNDLNNQTNPASPTVALVNGGSVSGDFRVFNNSTVNISGGIVIALNNTVSFGDNSTVNISSGGVRGNVTVTGHSTANITGGSITGPALRGILYAVGNSTVNFSGGSTNPLFAYYNSTVNISGTATMSTLLARDNSTINMGGGRVATSLVAYKSTIVNVSGGSVSEYLEADDSSSINLFGTGQTATLLTSDNGKGLSQYSVSGLLADGTLLVNKTLYVQNGTGARFTLNNTFAAVVPEPGSVSLLVGVGVSGAGFLVRHRRSAKKAA